MLASIIPTTRLVAKQLTSAMFRELTSRERFDFHIKLWDGAHFTFGSFPQFTLTINHPSALRTMLNSPDELTLGELFVQGDLDIDGDFDCALRFAEHLVTTPPILQDSLLRTLSHVLPAKNDNEPEVRGNRLTGTVHSLARDRAAIAYHYDLSSDFYRLWLDSHMLYSSAYFECSEENLEAAQKRKLDYICRKLRLKSSDKLLDLGCGWGGLVIHASQNYGVQAYGITLSVPQADLARERIRSAGLEDRCSVRICDYRELEEQERYDKIASIGMFEHVGRDMLGVYFNQAWRLLRPGGVLLNSGITASTTYKRPGASFIDRYVFPDGDLVPLHDAIQTAEECGFEVRDIEQLREHYALTLDRWVRNLEEHAREAQQMVGNETYRIWRLYMSASARAFRIGRIQLYQLLLSKPDKGHSDIPLTRKDWYMTDQRHV